MTAAVRHPATRGTLFVEDARVVEQRAHAGAQQVMRLHAPQTAAAAKPGQFVHLRCHPALPMRRPMSIMRAAPRDGCIDLLYKVHGHGTALLAARQPDERVSLIGPIGVPFRLEGYRGRALLIGGGVGIPPMVFLAEHLKAAGLAARTLAILGSEVPFPFAAQPSRIMTPGIPDGVIAAMPLLEDWGIASRLCSRQGYGGCFDGLVTELARAWLGSLDAGARGELEIFSCGPTPMLRAVAALAAEFGVPCQVSLEEYMACAVGGCAGCVVRLTGPGGPAMRRVCVDGPVFDAAAVDWS